MLQVCNNTKYCMRVSSYLSEPLIELSLAFATVSATSAGGTANPPSSRDRRSGDHGRAGGRRRLGAGRER